MEMRATVTEQSALVAAAQSGDQRAVQDLVSRHLPLVYSIVRRAMGEHPDVDDVVQDIMLRALRELPELRNPASFRAWLSAISVRQVGTHLHRRQVGATRTTTLDVIAEMPDARSEFENVTLLELEVSDQRKALERAAQWLNQDDRTLLSLWWLEVAGSLTRADLAEAIGLNVAHATVRIQRMRGQLQLSRALVAALDARPECPRLAAAQAGWNGRPSSLWRKRLTRHTRSCSLCRRAAGGLVTPERLLAGYLLLPVPLTLASGLLAKVALTASSPAPPAALATAKTGVVAHLLHAVAGHPVVVAVVTGTVITGTTVTTTTWPEPQPPRPDVTVVPVPVPSSIQPTRRQISRPIESSSPTRTSPPPTITRTERTLTAGSVSLESANEPGFFISTSQTFAFLTRPPRSGTQAARRAATFVAVPGLAEPSCFSFRLPDGRYLRHSSWRMRVSADEGSELFRGDATFCVRAGSDRGTIALESFNYPSYFIHRRELEIWVDQRDGKRQFDRDTSFRVSTPLAD